MPKPLSFVDQEPAVFIGLLQALVQALLSLVTAFGLHVTVEQAGAVHGTTAAALAVVGAIWTRSRVAPTKALDALAATAPALAPASRKRRT